MTSFGEVFKPGLLFVSDSPSPYEKLLPPAGESGFRVFFCGKKDNIFSAIENKGIKVVIMDITQDEAWETKLLKIIRAIDPIIEIVLAGPPLPSARVIEWIRLGATDYTILPLQPEVLDLILKRQEEKRLIRKETFELELKLEKKFVFQGMVGRSPFMLDIFALIENAAKHFSTVLITGETGTGKELVARALHQLSPVCRQKFVTCDCTSQPEHLFESEFFGYVRGAFTGADKDKKGLFEEANHGIIFMDEIGDFPFPMQGKLLRVLELNRFRPLGSTVERTAEVKVIAATNMRLEENVQKGTFREDLFHRLTKVEIHLPPLRDRAEDILLLARHFLAKYNQKFEKAIKGISREVQKFFQVYNWPGNVREMENTIENACLVCRKEFIDLIDLPKSLQKKLPSLSKKMPYFGVSPRSLQDLEKEYIEHLFRANDENIKKTAEILNISRTSLYSKLEKYQIKKNPEK
jgi:DNA-binding NtrC family response regulator